MRLPAFFDRVPRLRVRDPLAALLGSAEDGILEYGYDDAVRLAGHSCPTVAAAYWLSCRAMQALYPDGLPQRGGVRVALRDDPRDGANGVVAAVVQLLTGAAGDTGFKGLLGQHVRAGLLRTSAELPMLLRFTRIDSGRAVDAFADLSLLPEPPQLMPLLRRCTGGGASADEHRELARLWQQRVELLLCELRDDDAVFVIRDAGWPWRAARAEASVKPALPSRA